ncbi:MAG: pentapeptide repeat-containing protein, partial [Myxococcota bacterium]
LIEGYLVGPGADLTGANFTNADLSYAVLTDTNLTGAEFTDANLSFVKSGNITGTPAVLPTDWRLIEGYLVGPGADLTGANLNNADLTNMFLYFANFTNADLTDVTWTGATCPDLTIVDGATVTSCCGHLNGATPAAGCP